ncbi:hypothetical protein GCM10007421_12220 [Halopseudomonas oceani]|nr:hypothetical protein GCM10007421_12220 [Halopseudomonas oceani]
MREQARLSDLALRLKGAGLLSCAQSLLDDRPENSPVGHHKKYKFKGGTWHFSCFLV